MEFVMGATSLIIGPGASFYELLLQVAEIIGRFGPPKTHKHI